MCGHVRVGSKHSTDDEMSLDQFEAFCEATALCPGFMPQAAANAVFREV